MKPVTFHDILEKTAGAFKNRAQNELDYVNELRTEWESREEFDPAKHAFVKVPYRKN
jgi:hypothetical protein